MDGFKTLTWLGVRSKINMSYNLSENEKILQLHVETNVYH